MSAGIPIVASAVGGVPEHTAMILAVMAYARRLNQRARGLRQLASLCSVITSGSCVNLAAIPAATELANICA